MSEAPDEAPVAALPRPRSPSVPQPPNRMAAVDTTTPAPPPPAPEPSPEPAPEEETAPETPPEPETPDTAAEPPQPDPAPEVPAEPLATAPRAVVPVARPREVARPQPEPEAPQPEAPETAEAAPTLDDLVAQAQQQATAPEATGAGSPDLTREQRGLLIRGIRQHFVPPEGIANAQSLAVTFLIEVGRNSRITSSELVSPSGTLDAAHNALRLRAVQALIRANDDGLFGQLPQDRYDTWRRMRITFTPEDLLL
jgi:outer membrane biosynthesis protein TonB